MSTAYNALTAREDYNIAFDAFTSAGFDPSITRLTPGSIRLEQALTANQNLYNFPVLVNVNNQTIFNTEIRLQQQDSICATQIGIFLANPSSSTDATYRLFTYPNPAVFTNATQMNAIYQNGRLNMTINNDVWLKQYDVYRHWKTSQTQQTAAVGAGSPMDQLDGVEDGFFPMTPFIIMKGSADIQLNLIMNLASPTAVDANSRLVIIFRGFLAQMSTVIQ